MADFGDAYPVRLHGDYDETLSRWLWLVKWLLAIPHLIVLIFLGIAFVVVTGIAFFAVLFTGHYPRSLFDFNVGVLRWSWRVRFYAFSVLGTDKYPPFSLRSSDYPADLQIDYPERLSRGLVLVKWWLLAIPHYLVVAAMVGAAMKFFDINDKPPLGTISLLGVLILIAAVSLLFRGRYPRGVFDFVLGINRWAYRVASYAWLLRDEYPPFRLDQGPHEPAGGPDERARASALDSGEQ